MVIKSESHNFELEFIDGNPGAVYIDYHGYKLYVELDTLPKEEQEVFFRWKRRITLLCEKGASVFCELLAV